MSIPVRTSLRPVPARWKLLATVGGSVAALPAGCIGGDDTAGTADDGNQGATQTSGNQTDGDGSTDTDGEGDPLQTPEGFPDSCPEYDRVETVVCYDTVDTDEVAAYLDPAERTVQSGESLDFSLRNNSERILETNFYNWALHKHVEGEWHRIAPREWAQPLMHLAPGDVHTWTVTVQNDGVLAGEPTTGSGETEGVTLEGLGGGHYAFRGRGWFEDASHEDALAFAAMFELDGDPLSLVPTDAITHTEFEGETLVATSSRGDAEKHQLVSYTLERVEEPSKEPRTVLTEQVYRYEQFRDVFALACQHDADTVRLEEHTGPIPQVSMGLDGYIQFQGSTYRIAAGN